MARFMLPRRTLGSSSVSRVAQRVVVLALAVCGVVGVASIPAYAATKGPISYGGCLDTGKTYDTYPTAQVEYDQNSKSSTKIDYNMWTYGYTYDCGPAGNAQSVSSLKVQIVYKVSGTKIDCTTSVGAGGDGITVTESCGSSNSSSTVTETYTCKDVSACHIADGNVTFTSLSGGKISHYEVWGKSTISGSDGSSTASSYVKVF